MIIDALHIRNSLKIGVIFTSDAKKSKRMWRVFETEDTYCGNPQDIVILLLFPIEQCMKDGKFCGAGGKKEIELIMKNNACPRRNSGFMYNTILMSASLCN